MSVKFKDYYKLLGVQKSSSATDIKKGYRQMSRKWHPDVNKAPGAEDRFKDIQEAYAVLGDTEKKRRYDMFGGSQRGGEDFRPPPGFHSAGGGSGGGAGGFAGFGGFSDTGFSDFFDMMFGGFGGFSEHQNLQQRRGGGKPRSMRAPDSEAELTLSLEKFIEGGKQQFSIKSSTYNGIVSKTLNVTIPKGIKPSSKLKLTGQGFPGPLGESPGNLILTINVRNHKWFKVEGFDLHLNLPVTPWEAALGAKISVPTLNGMVKASIPSGVKNEHKLKLPSLGLPNKSGKNGSLVLHIQIVVPKELSPEMRKLIEKLADIAEFNPRKW